MSFPGKHLLDDPPPRLVFEITERSVAAVLRDRKNGGVAGEACRELAPGVVESSASKENVHRPEELLEAVESVARELGPLKRPEAALLIPDGAVRLTVLEFDTLPSDEQERQKLIRFRLKKTVPFDINEAKLVYHAQRTSGGLAVIVAVTPPEVVRQYEAAFESLGLWPGYVAPSLTAALNLAPPGEMSLLAKLAGATLSMAAIEGGVVRMVRSVDLAHNPEWSAREALEDIVADIYPTSVFIADNLGAPVSAIYLCGFENLLEPALQEFPREMGCRAEPLRSPAGVAGAHNAGIWGYLSGN